VERVTIEDGKVIGIAVQLEARPFFDDLGDGLAMAPPDGLWGSPSDSGTGLEWYAVA
jgi:hypothetical protein